MNLVFMGFEAYLSGYKNNNGFLFFIPFIADTLESDDKQSLSQFHGARLA